MKNKAYQFTQMESDERSMHLFYTIENMVESLQAIGKELDPDSGIGATRLALLTDLDDQIQSLYDRVNKDFIANKTKNAISYSI